MDLPAAAAVDGVLVAVAAAADALDHLAVNLAREEIAFDRARPQKRQPENCKSRIAAIPSHFPGKIYKTGGG